MCQTPEGCPVPDAAEPVINEFIARYRMARSLYEINKIASLYESALDELGLLENRELLFHLECLFVKWKALKTKEQEKETEWNKIIDEDGNLS